MESSEGNNLAEAVAFHLGRRALDIVGRLLHVAAQEGHTAHVVVVGVYRDADHLRRYLDYHDQDEPPQPLVLDARRVSPQVMRALGALSPATVDFLRQYAMDSAEAVEDKVAVVIQVRDDPSCATVCTYDIDRLLQGHAAVEEVKNSVERQLEGMRARSERHRRWVVWAAWVMVAVWALLVAWGVRIFFGH